MPPSGVEHPGTYLGVIEKIPYLKSLGVTAVELMPVHEFPIESALGPEAGTAQLLGLRPDGVFLAAPRLRRPAEAGLPGRRIQADGEGPARGGHRSDSRRGVQPHGRRQRTGADAQLQGSGEPVYYMLGNGGSYYTNFSGCGNTVNGNHPIVREMIFLCLRHWVHNYHIDGFRFDLASILSRDRQRRAGAQSAGGRADCRRSAAGRHQSDCRSVGRGRRLSGRLVRQSALGRMERPLSRRRAPVSGAAIGDLLGRLATRLAGSSDLYQAGGRQPYHSINFVTSHDGFPLNDLVSYSDKHNEANGEGNRDGDNNNYSANYGVEGPTRKQNIEIDAPAADQELPGHADAQPGRADAAGRRRVPPHAARQQQRLLPGQRDLLVRLDAGRAKRTIWSGSCRD